MKFEMDLDPYNSGALARAVEQEHAVTKEIDWLVFTQGG
jgi:hypothetical protein